MRWDLILGCFNGPRVYRKYRDGSTFSPSDSTNGAYRSNFVEEQCSSLVGIIEMCWSVALYASPLIAFNAAMRRSIFGMSPEFALKFAIGVACFYGGAYLGRGLGRAANKDYLTFLQALIAAAQPSDNASLVKNNLRNLRRYDFDFRYWPIDYQWRETDKDGEKIHARRFLDEVVRPPGENIFKKLALDGLSYVVAHTVARRLAYPGTLAILQTAVSPALQQGRAKLIEEMNGQRFKLRTKTGTEIDTMFVDRRNDHRYSHGNVLVITCEGNAGFYEVGSAVTPLEAKFSVLMWNHPGFGGSTGTPWPSEDAAAMDVVIQFALNQLGWDESDIVMYGWSIGGFTATWAGMNYRNLRGLVLDATFDDIVPLALHTMPKSWAPLVERTVRTYLNLHIERQLAQYDGPVVLVRRLRDEVMAAVEGAFDLDGMRKINRANNLLKSLLLRRYPNIFGDAAVEKAVDEWLAAKEGERVSLMNRYDVDVQECRAVLADFVESIEETTDDEDKEIFPLLIGRGLDMEERRELGLYLAASYLVEFDSTHCIPLPADKFAVPVHPWQ